MKKALKKAIAALLACVFCLSLLPAAVTAVATDLLARKNSSRLAMLGTGAQARSHLAAIPKVRPIDTVMVWGYYKDEAERYADEMRKAHPELSITVCDTVAEAVADADIVTSVCRCREPIIFADMIRPGTHVNAIGTCSPVSREASSDLVAASRLYVDQIEACKAESGEYLIPLKEGLITEGHIVGSIGAVINGTAPARGNDDEITLFDSLGLAIEDVICADELYKEVLAK